MSLNGICRDPPTVIQRLAKNGVGLMGIKDPDGAERPLLAPILAHGDNGNTSIHESTVKDAPPVPLWRYFERIFVISVLLVSAVGVSVFMGIIYPLISTCIKSPAFNGTDFTVGLINSVHGGALFVGSLSTMPIIRRLGTFTTFFIFSICTAVTTWFLFLSIGQIFWWAFFHALFGFADAPLWIISEMWANSILSDRWRSVGLGFYAVAMGVGFVLGPMLLSFFDIANWPIYALCTIMALATPLMTLPVAYTAPNASDEDEPSLSIWGALRRAPLLPACGFLAGTLSIVFDSLMSVFFINRGYSTAASVRILAVIMFGNLILQLPFSIALKIFGLSISLPLTLIICLICQVAVPLLRPVVQHELLPFPLDIIPLVVIFIILMVYGTAALGLYTLSMIMVGDSYTEVDLGTGTMVMVISYQIGAVISPLIISYFMDYLPESMWIICFMITGATLAGLIVYLVARKGTLVNKRE